MFIKPTLLAQLLALAFLYQEKLLFVRYSTLPYGEFKFIALLDVKFYIQIIGMAIDENVINYYI